MKSKDRKYSFYIEDILISMERIEEYITGLDFAIFKQNYMIVDAVVRNFEIIGEASKHIPSEIAEKYPDIPWKKMYGLRNIVSHEYFGIDYETIWKIASDELPNNIIDLRNLIEQEKMHWQ